MSDTADIDVKESLEVLIDASKGAWDLDADELLLNTLSALQEKFLDRLNEVRKDVDGLSEDVRKATSEFQNTVNDFIQLSQNQFVENRCAVEDDTKVNESDSETESELDDQEKAKMVYTDAVQTCITALEERSIPLFESDDEMPENSDAESEISDDSDVPNARDHYRRRPLLAVIGSVEFLSDPHCGLGGDPYMEESSDDASSDSEAEPIAFVRQQVPSPPHVNVKPANIPAPVPQSSAAPAPVIPSQLESRSVPVQNLRERVLKFYEVYNPSKLSEVDSILSKFVGREDALIPALIKRYGPEPTMTNNANAPPPKKAFGADDSDSDADAAPKPAPKKAPPPPAKKAPAKKAVASESESDSDSDAAPKPAPKKAPPPPAKKAVASDSDSESDAAPKPAPKRAPPPPAKKAPAKKAVASESDSESDAAPKPAPKKAPPRKLPTPKLITSDSDSDTPALVAKRPLTTRPKVKPSKAAIYSDSD